MTLICGWAYCICPLAYSKKNTLSDFWFVQLGMEMMLIMKALLICYHTWYLSTQEQESIFHPILNFQ